MEHKITLENVLRCFGLAWIPSASIVLEEDSKLHLN